MDSSEPMVLLHDDDCVEIGVKENDRVTICMPNAPQTVMMFYAVNLVGAIANMIHPLSAPGEIAFYLNFSQSKAILTLDQFYSKIAPIIPELDEWRTLVEKQRRIFAVESMIVKNYDLPLGEKLKFIEDYLTEKRYNDFMYFKTISESYLENKPQESEIAARINEIMENLYK